MDLMFMCNAMAQRIYEHKLKGRFVEYKHIKALLYSLKWQIFISSWKLNQLIIWLK